MNIPKIEECIRKMITVMGVVFFKKLNINLKIIKLNIRTVIDL
jgi:hypothetical protein